MKRFLKIIGVVLLTIVLLLFILPFVFQSKIKEIVKRSINENVNAKVDFSNVSLSLFSSFPKANLKIHDLVITNFKPFEGDTLASAKSIALTMSIKELFKNKDDDPIAINAIDVNTANVLVKTNADGKANYDISKESNTTPNKDAVEDPSSGFALNINHYSISGSQINYLDATSKLSCSISNLNHQGNASVSSNQLEFDTNTEAHISLSLDSINYLTNTALKLDALIGVDLNNNRFTFKENKAFINAMPLSFDGYLETKDNGQEIDVSFENPGSSFKDFLAVIPSVYSKGVAQVETTGNFKIKGKVFGLMSENTIPKFEINLHSNNASFKYPDLPKRVEHININAAINNKTGNLDDTFIDTKNLSFKIDEDVFKSSFVISQLTKNIKVNADLDGTLNLAKLTQVYPIDLETELSGILKSKLNTAFDVEALNTNAYARIKNNGVIHLTDFVYKSNEVNNPINITEAEIQLSPSTVKLNTFKAHTGQSDLSANGTINNLLGFMLSDKNLKGTFNLKSNTFAVSDFMEEEPSEGNTQKDDNGNSSSTTQALKIPAFLECTIIADAQQVLYDNLNLKNVKGTLTIKDQKAALKNMSSKLFDGDLSITGDVDTKPDIPTFNMNLDVSNFDISESFKNMELLQKLAPIAQALQGKFNTAIALKGNLDSAFAPDLSTISGTANTEINTTPDAPIDSQLLNQLGQSLNVVDLNKLNLKDLKTHLEFSNGKVSVKPFKVAYKDIDIQVSGSHSFDNSLSYNAVFNVPAKYLGSDVNQLINNLNDTSAEKISIPVTANITGTYLSPNIATDLKSGVTNLTSQLIKAQKQKLINKGTNELSNVLGGLLGGTKDTPKDTVSTPKDSTKVDQSTMPPKKNLEDNVKDVLGLFGKKKKKVKDTVN